MSDGTMEITTVIGCGIACRYCPQSRLVRSYRSRSGVLKMTFDLFRACVDKIPSRVRIDFSGMAEPWLNGQCTAMLLHAAERGHEIAVYTTLRGMTHEDFDALKDLAYDYFVIHIPDADGNSGIPVDDGYLGLLDRIVHHPLNVAGERQFSCHGTVHPAVRSVVNGTFPVFSTMIDRAGNLRRGDLQPSFHRGRIKCGRTAQELNHNVLLPDGTVLLCCMDYNMDHILGNLLLQEYDRLFRADGYRGVQRALDDETADSLCRKCSAAAAIDDDDTELAARVEALFRGGEIVPAFRLAGEIAEKHPGNFVNWNNLGVMLDSIGRSGEAKECLRIALSLDSRFAEARNNLEALEDRSAEPGLKVPDGRIPAEPGRGPGPGSSRASG